jgi:lysozyme family protein
MADFPLAYRAILRPYEGGLSIDPDDPGGLTWRGVTMRDHPDWPGWSIARRALADRGYSLDSAAWQIEPVLRDCADLETSVQRLCKSEYWDPWWGDRFPVQATAEEVLDAQYNTGRGIKFLQSGLNHINWTPGGRLWPEIAEDNRMGPQTWNAMLACVRHPRRGPHLLCRLQNVAQAMHYWQLQDRRESFEKFVGWWKRTETIPKHYPEPERYYRYQVHEA